MRSPAEALQPSRLPPPPQVWHRCRRRPFPPTKPTPLIPPSPPTGATQPTPGPRPQGFDPVAKLTAQVLLAGYCQGYFPMASGGRGPIEFFTADPRAVLPIAADPGEPGGPHLSKSLRAAVRRARFVIRTDTCFERVMRACAAPRNGGEWISEQMVPGYVALHQQQHAHSVEAWLVDHTGSERLVGGLYGVHIGGAFFGESMFSRPDEGGTDASKICFVYLCRHLRARGFELLDTQFSNPHMEQFGIVEIPLGEYLERLSVALSRSTTWLPWDQWGSSIAS